MAPVGGWGSGLTRGSGKHDGGGSTRVAAVDLLDRGPGRASPLLHHELTNPHLHTTPTQSWMTSWELDACGKAAPLHGAPPLRIRRSPVDCVGPPHLPQTFGGVRMADANVDVMQRFRTKNPVGARSSQEQGLGGSRCTHVCGRGAFLLETPVGLIGGVTLQDGQREGEQAQAVNPAARS